MFDSYHMKICSEKTGYEVKPKAQMKLDLTALKDEIVTITGMNVRVGVPALLLIEGKDGQVVNIFPSGRLLLRKFPTQDAAEAMVRLLAPLLYNSKSE